MSGPQFRARRSAVGFLSLPLPLEGGYGQLLELVHFHIGSACCTASRDVWGTSGHPGAILWAGVPLRGPGPLSLPTGLLAPWTDSGPLTPWEQAFLASFTPNPPCRVDMSRSVLG